MMVGKEKPLERQDKDAFNVKVGKVVKSLEDKLKKTAKNHGVVITARLLALNLSFHLKYWVINKHGHNHRYDHQKDLTPEGKRGRREQESRKDAVKVVTESDAFQKAAATVGFPPVDDTEIESKSDFVNAMLTGQGILTGLLPAGLDEQDVYVGFRVVLFV